MTHFSERAESSIPVVERAWQRSRDELLERVLAEVRGVAKRGRVARKEIDFFA